MEESKRNNTAATMARINHAWLYGQVDNLLEGVWIAVWRTMLDMEEKPDAGMQQTGISAAYRAVDVEFARPRK
jgi:hypothetical protein